MTHEAVKKPVEDWEPARIKYELHRRGMTLAGLARAYGLSDSTSLSATFVRSYPLNEKRIADAIGVEPMVIWPSRYNLDGSIKPRGFRLLQFNATANAVNTKRTAADSKLRKVV